MVERQSLEQEIMDVEKQIAAANRKIEQYTTYKVCLPPSFYVMGWRCWR